MTSTDVELNLSETEVPVSIALIFRLTKVLARAITREYAALNDGKAQEVVGLTRELLEVAARKPWSQTHPVAAVEPTKGSTAGEQLATRGNLDSGPQHDNERLRFLLWCSHMGRCGLYGDDGEMQDHTCHIDFKRDSIERIEQQTRKRGERLLAAALVPVSAPPLPPGEQTPRSEATSGEGATAPETVYRCPSCDSRSVPR